MASQQLAFLLVKSVVTTRDDAMVLPAPLLTAWTMVREEMSPAHRVMSDEVHWRPDEQDDLKFVIAGVKEQLDADPELAAMIGPLLSNVDMIQVKPGHEATSEPIPARSAAAVAVAAQPKSTITNSQPAAEATVVNNAPSGTKSAAYSPRVRAIGWPLVQVVLAVASFLLVAMVWKVSHGPNMDAGATQVLATGDSMIAPTTAFLPVSLDVVETDEEMELRRAEGDYAAAKEAQESRIVRLTQANAPPAELSEAYVELATLSAATGDYRAAVDAQRAGLEAAYEAPSIGNDAVAVGRNHLALGRYYFLTGQTIMAQAHLRQARHLFGQIQDITSAGELSSKADELEKDLEQGS